MKRYETQVDSALPYLAERGLASEAVSEFRLGFVENPVVGHESYVGRVAIPYFSVTGHVVGIRFRAVPGITQGGDGFKYLGLDGVDTRLYGLGCLSDPLVNHIVIVEGEIDAITMSICGYATVGVPGSNNWKPHHPRIFQGFERITVIADGDPVNPSTGKRAGHEFARKVSATLPDASVIHLPEGEDANSIYVAKGKDGIDELFREDED